MRMNGVKRLGSVALVSSLALGAAIAQSAPRPIPPNSNAYGTSYAQLGAEWTEWAFEAPSGSNPILDPDGSFAAVGQDGKVWFLGGTFGGPGERTISLPPATPVFLPIVNSFWVNVPEAGDDPWSPEQEIVAREAVAEMIDGATNLSLEVDGHPIPVTERLRVQSPVAICDLPEDSVYDYFGYTVDTGPHECLADGYWALLPPLSVGEHTIRFGASLEGGFVVDMTYHITVKPKPKLAGKSARGLVH